MPTYQYACTACEHRLEAVQSFSDEPLTECPECQGRLRKVYGSVGVVFKGSGFYRTDSRSNGSSANGSGDGAGGDSSGGKGSADKGDGKSSGTSGGDSGGGGAASSTGSGGGTGGSGKQSTVKTGS